MNESQIRNATESELLNHLGAVLTGLELIAFKRYSEIMEEESSIAENAVAKISDYADKIKDLVSE